MNRRRAILSFTALGMTAFSPLRSHAQERRNKLIGILSPQPPQPPARAQRSLERFAKLGWKMNENLAFERPVGDEEKLDAMAAGLVGKRVDLIWAFGPEAAVAAARATKTIPIVFWGVALPVELELVNSIARPGTNCTGVAFFTGAELFAKQLEFLKLAVPSARRVSWLSIPSASRTVSGGNAQPLYTKLIDAAAQDLNLELRRHFVAKESDFEQAFAEIRAWRPDALGAPGTALTWRNRTLITEFAERTRLPAAYSQPEFTEAGGLLSYGADTGETILRTIDYIDRVFRGARPADLAVELPSKYELLLNLKTAKALGIAFPQPLLARADRIVE